MTAAETDKTADRLLQALADPRQPEIDARDVALVIAHPDDEAVGCGGQLVRLRGITVILVTDGAPRNLADAHAHGFSSADAYAGARWRELQGALACAGIPQNSLIRLGVPDQQAARNLTAVTRTLASLFAPERFRCVLTHAYEGGHPDHDATAFAVHVASRMLGSKPAILEMPFYRSGGMQRFWPDPRYPEVSVALNGRQKALKQSMLKSHHTQRAALAQFAVDVERFRRAPAYDFCAPPNGGDILYDSYDWGLRSSDWTGLARAALAELAAGSRS